MQDARQSAYLTIARIGGDPAQLLDGYLSSNETMDGVGRDHGLILHAAAPTDDALDASGDASSAANDATVAPSASPPAPAPYVTRSVTIERSFDSAALKAGVSPQVAASLVKAFSSEIDFRRDLQKGDSFTLVFKRNGIDGDDVAADRKPVAAKIDLGSTTHTIYWYRKPGGEGSYYTPNGSSTLPAYSRLASHQGRPISCSPIGIPNCTHTHTAISSAARALTNRLDRHLTRHVRLPK